jgi:hypothetical protein
VVPPAVVWAKAALLRPMVNNAARRILVVFMIKTGWKVEMWKG